MGDELHQPVYKVVRMRPLSRRRQMAEAASGEASPH